MKKVFRFHNRRGGAFTAEAGRCAKTGDDKIRLKLIINGAVQGVGFRPFVYRLAQELALTGWVNNTPQGVQIEVEGPKKKVLDFALRCEKEKPVNAFIQSMESAFLDPADYDHFEIIESDVTGQKTAFMLPDIAACSDCLREIFDPQNRRHLYPFTNCTNCGPRFTIIEALPYDRPNTSMKHFLMCPKCTQEYHNPADRRFHAQPNACPQCGPQLQLWSPGGDVLAEDHKALIQTSKVILQGGIAAIKGLGGFHLVVDARNEQATRLLRQRKHREEKPLAIMMPDLEMIGRYCHVCRQEARLLQSPAGPIVLLERTDLAQSEIAPSVAPANPYLGIMLPYTPLHHVLMRELNIPVIATSGNVSDEPICTDEHEALNRLAGIADVFLVHNRPIVRHVDDSIVRIMGGRELTLRRARGYAPLPILLAKPLPNLLAVGAHLKNNVAVTKGRNVFVSQHIGDLETTEAYAAFEKVIEDFQRLYELHPESVACDNHQDYLSTRYAFQTQLPVTSIQHHLAHVLSCAAENELEGTVLGVAWDGMGLGSDGSIWGGEFLQVNDSSWRRVAHLRPFGLPGADRAMREPRRAACGILYEIFGEKLAQLSQLLPVQAFSSNELKIMMKMLSKRINTFETTSAGRLFDAVASLMGIRQINRHEGQAAMELEFAIDKVNTDECYSISIDHAKGSTESPLLLIDWEVMVREIIEDKQNNALPGLISAKFHNTLAEAIVGVAVRIGQEKVLLTGGCFQNKYLTERTINRLKQEGLRPYWHQRLPPNDGGVAVGQIVAAAQKLRPL